MENLQMLSPKFLKLLDNITDEENEGKHLIYTNLERLKVLLLLNLYLNIMDLFNSKLKEIVVMIGY